MRMCLDLSVVYSLSYHVFLANDSCIRLAWPGLRQLRFPMTPRPEGRPYTAPETLTSCNPPARPCAVLPRMVRDNDTTVYGVQFNL
jgi:hypothetical protein